jgi:hypothetical protein
VNGATYRQKKEGVWVAGPSIRGKGNEAVVGDGHKGPLNNQGKPTYFRKKQNADEPKTRVR